MILFPPWNGIVVVGPGAEILVRGASRLAAAAGISPLVIGLTVVAFRTSAPERMVRHLGISEMTIGLTLVAAGTSLPEAATSVVATFRGQRDIAVGNVVGSNIFNILAVLGLSGIVSTDGIPVSEASLGFDIPVILHDDVTGPNEL